MRNVNDRPLHWMPRKGDRVDYHSLIGGPVTSSDHVVRAVETSHSGYPVAWLTNKAGCVAADALTPAKEKPDTTCHLCGLDSPRRFMWTFGRRQVFVCQSCATILEGDKPNEPEKPTDYDYESSGGWRK